LVVSGVEDGPAAAEKQRRIPDFNPIMPPSRRDATQQSTKNRFHDEGETISAIATAQGWMPPREVL